MSHSTTYRDGIAPEEPGLRSGPVVIGVSNRFTADVQSLRDLGGNSMQKMLEYLMERPEKGLLGYQQHGVFGVTVQYWRSFDHLEAFARDTDDPHLEVWRNFWKRVGKSGRTGIWHETFLVRAGEYEAIYGNMPAYGLGKASKVVLVAESVGARNRLKASAS